MHLVFVASEAVPFAKTGGLADVVGALPGTLSQLGHKVTVIMPCYKRCLPFVKLPSYRPAIEVNIGGKRISGMVKEAVSPSPGVRVLLIDQPDYFHRGGLYLDENGVDYHDNCERFVFLCRAAFAALEAMDLDVDVLHAHDWHTGLVPAYLRTLYRHHPRFRKTASIFTIHNIAFQGIFEHRQYALTELPQWLYHFEGLEYFGRFSCLKAGIVYSDLVTTVSRNYAEEIQGPEFGVGMDPVLRHRGDRLAGIVNGIDYEQWNPATDSTLTARFDTSNWREGKRQCKDALRAELGLAQKGDAPLLGVVGRLTDQKGLDLMVQILGELLHSDVQLVVLGTGDARYEGYLERMSKMAGAKLATRIQFDEGLARRIYAASDMFLMPSRFEPCGLSQLYSLRYGTVPIVRAVGGLVDTVVDTNPATIMNETATGFHFHHYTPAAFLSAIRRALKLYADDQAWGAIVERGMTQDWSWLKSAHQYVDLYQRAMSLVQSSS